MPKVKVDGVEIEVPQGLRIEADAKGVREFLAEPFYHAMTGARSTEGN